MPLLNFLKQQVRRARSSWHYAGMTQLPKPTSKMSLRDFSHCLDRLGIAEGDFLLVHHSSDALALEFNPLELITSLQKRVGKHGHLMMLATPFFSRSITYLQSSPRFDLRSPCQMGLLSEVFRRSTGVYRTPHPISSVCLWGPDAERISSSHRNLEFAFGEDSPFGFADRMGAKILGLGVEMTTLSPMHYMEHLRRERYKVYTDELYTVRLVAGTPPTETAFQTRALNPESLRRWKALKTALNARSESRYFQASGRLFYAYQFDILKSVVFQLMDENRYFRKI